MPSEACLLVSFGASAMTARAAVTASADRAGVPPASAWLSPGTTAEQLVAHTDLRGQGGVRALAVEAEQLLLVLGASPSLATSARVDPAAGATGGADPLTLSLLRSKPHLRGPLGAGAPEGGSLGCCDHVPRLVHAMQLT